MRSWQNLVLIGFAFLGLVLALGSRVAQAEPWLSSRFAQNCATCHAPGRVNVVSTERRCSLSCQGCHTNPNGGGLRNQYGKWMQERWLNSGYIRGYKLNKPRPAVSDQQHYAPERLKAFLAKGDAKDIAKYKARGFPLRETAAQLSEWDYDRRSTNEKLVVPDLDEAHLRIPENDPWRLRREQYFNAGIDMRYFHLRDTPPTGSTKDYGFLMGADLAVSVEPVHHYTLVFESRFLNSMTRPAWNEGFTTASVVRSAYLLVDDLPYNSYVQYGIFRPMFGNYNPDHTSLFANATGFNQRSVYNAFSIGAAPNVPFVNLHYIMPLANDSLNQDRGFAANAGLRFVTLGAYVTASYWSTQVDQGGGTTTSLKKVFSNLTGGMTVGPVTLVGDFTRYLNEQGITKNAGTLMIGEARVNVYKQTYLKALYETMNTATDYNPGSAKQTGFGVSSFVISSLELELMFKDRLEKKSGQADTKDKFAWMQAHFYF